MENTNKKFEKPSLIKIIFCIVGNAAIGLGAAIMKIAAFGNDPYNGGCMAISEFFNFDYVYFTLIFNCALFLIEFIFGRKHIHIGTFINWFLICYAVSFFLFVFDKISFVTPDGFVLRFLILIAGLLTAAFGVAMYQVCDLGISPYDSIPIILTERFPKVKYFWFRVATDGIMTAGIFFCGGIVSIGTFAAFFGLGPIINMFMNILKKRFKKLCE